MAEQNSAKKIRLLYWGGYIFILIMFFVLLHKQIATSYYEEDIWWYIPTMFHHLTTMTPGQLLKFFISPEPLTYAIPCMKIYSVLILRFLGSSTSYFIYVSLIFFVLCSILLFSLVRKMKVDYRVSFLSAMVFLSAYMHFHSYMWPIAIIHLLVVFFMLLTLNLYLRTDEIITNKGNYKKFYLLTLFVNLLATLLCRVNIIMLPIIILSHILFSTKNAKESTAKYNLWIPLFVTYLFYPLITLAFAGEMRVFFKFREGEFFKFFLAFLTPLLRFTILFIFGIFCIFIFRIILKLCNEKFFRILRRSFVVLLILLMFFGAGISIKRFIILPYAIFSLFAGTLGIFLNPIRNVLTSSPSTYYFYRMCLDLSFSTLLLGLFFIGIFIRIFWQKKGLLAMLLTWHVLVLFYVCFHTLFPSRYFIYFMPIFSVVFSSVIVYVYKIFKDKIKLSAIYKETLLILIIIGLSFVNISAISLRMWRDKLVNSFWIYDYIRSANIIKQDILKTKKDFSAKDIYINNITPMPVEEWWDFSPVNPNNYYNFRFALMQIFNNDSMFEVHINQNPSSKNQNCRLYRLKGVRIYNEKGENIDTFSRLFEDGKKQIGLNNGKAKKLIQAAIQEKPFLLKYLLPKNADLSVLKWLCGDNDLRTWIRKIAYLQHHGHGSKNTESNSINTLINQEIDEYIQCFFLVSYLNYLSGNITESKQWFYEMSFLESNYNHLLTWLNKLPLVKNNKEMSEFLHNRDNSLWCIDVNLEGARGFLRFTRFFILKFI